MAGAFLIGMVIGLAIYILIGALVLRAACWISNKCLPQPQPRYDDDDDDYDDRDRDDDYDAPRPRRRRGRAPLTAIPEPNFGKACGIMAVNVLVQLVIGFVLGMLIGAGGLRGGGIGTAQVLNVIIGFLVTAMLCTAMLPTTFGKACLVALFNFLIWLLIGVIVVVALIATIGLNF